MVFVTVVMACWVKAQSAILRLFLAIRIFRVLTPKPKPFSNCCWNPTNSDDCTDGLNKLACELEDERVLFHAVKKVVPVAKPWLYCMLYWAVCVTKLESVETPVPVPEVSGLLIGMVRLSNDRTVVTRGSKLVRGLLAVEPPKNAPGTAPGNPPALALRIPV